MSVLETLDFQPMLITDVFETITASKAWYDKNKIQTGHGAYPYVSRSKLANGHESVVGKQDLPPNAGNAITIGVDTQSVFYQPTPFYTSVKIQVLRHVRMTPASGLVLVSLLREQMMKFQWGNGVSLVRLQATRIMVPAITNLMVPLKSIGLVWIASVRNCSVISSHAHTVLARLISLTTTRSRI